MEHNCKRSYELQYTSHCLGCNLLSVPTIGPLVPGRGRVNAKLPHRNRFRKVTFFTLAEETHDSRQRDPITTRASRTCCYRISLLCISSANVKIDDFSKSVPLRQLGIYPNKRLVHWMLHLVSLEWIFNLLTFHCIVENRTILDRIRT